MESAKSLSSDKKLQSSFLSLRQLKSVSPSKLHTYEFKRFAEDKDRTAVLQSESSIQDITGTLSDAKKQKKRSIREFYTKVIKTLERIRFASLKKQRKQGETETSIVSDSNPSARFLNALRENAGKETHGTLDSLEASY